MPKKEKKLKPIKAESYDENEDLEIEEEFEEEKDVEVEIEDDYYEDDTTLGKDDNVEIKEVYEDEDLEDYEEAKDTFRRVNTDKLMKIFNILFIAAMIIMIIISIDIICVARYNVGPFFAIKTNTYKDGGTKVYYGIGYKVIKYNVSEGRKDTQIGFWNMPYSITPTPIEDIDLAIEFQNNPEKTVNKYYKQFLQIESTIKKINTKSNKLTLEYTDPDGKYTLEIDCSMASKKDDLTNYTEQQKISVRGTVYNFRLKDDNRVNTVYLSDCFANEIEKTAE